MCEEEKEEKCTRKGKTNREIERTRGIEEREKIRARASRRQWVEREKKGVGKRRRKREEIEEGREKAKNARVRELRDTRERLCRGYMEMLVKYIIPAWQCNSLICLAPPAALPQTIRALQGWMAVVVSARELLVNGETADRGLKRPIEDLQTRCHPLSLASSLHNLLFPSNLPQPRSTILYVLVHPRPSPSSTSANVLPTGLPCPTADLARWRTALQNRAKLRKYVD